MNKHRDEDEFLQKVNQQLDDAEQSLPAEVLSQLRRRRQLALDQMSSETKRQQANWWSWLLHGSADGSGTLVRPAGIAVAMMSVFAIVIGLTFLQTGSITNSDPLMDLPLLSAIEEFEFYEELEFYQWLEFEERTG